MKYKITLIIILLITINSYSQIIRVENAKYFDSNHELYNGLYKEFYDNGNPKFEMYLTNGEQDSITKLYFENGKLKEIRSYSKGLMHGPWETFNIKGQKIAEAWYRHDRKDGLWKIWDENGVLRYEMIYSNGNKIGIWKIFNEKGELVSERDYDKE